MTECEINERLRQACSHAVPEVWNAVLSDCTEQKGRVTIMEQYKQKKNPRARKLVGMAACFCLIAGSIFGLQTYRINNTVDATVSLDVNPSVEIQVNRKERVLEVLPLNEDGKTIVGDMDFSGSNLDVAVNALIGSMLQNGYLSELANSILISVDNNDPVRGAELQARLSEEVSKLLQTDTFSGAVLSQTVENDSSLRQLAEQYSITPGKAQLIQEILEKNPLHTFEELASLSINELNLLMTAGQATAKVESVGTASDKAYIGEAKAKELALSKAGVSAAALTWYEAELDAENGVMIYDVEFKAGGYEYDCEVNATTGAIMKFEKEADHDYKELAAGTVAGATVKTEQNNEGSASPAAQRPASGASITEAKARELALNHAGLTADAVTALWSKLDTDDGLTVYEVEFKSGGYEYSYEVNATTGAIVKFEKEADYDHKGMSADVVTGATTNVEKGNTVDPASSVSVTEAKARETALNHAGLTADAVTALWSKLDTDDGLTVYEVEFKSGGYEYSYEVNATTGAIVKFEKEADYDHKGMSADVVTGATTNVEKGNTVDPASSVSVTEAKARETALNHAGLTAGAVTALKSKLDTDDGLTVYEVEFKSGGYEYDYEIDAATGAILKAERDWDD